MANSPKDEIKAMIEQAKGLFDQAAALADANNIEFYCDIHGTGFTYRPQSLTYDAAIAIIENGAAITAELRDKIVEVLRNGRDSWQSSDETGWISSSAMC